MSRNINFVRERRKTISRQELDDKKVLAVVIKGLVVLGVVILVVVGARLYFLFQVKSIQAKQKETQTAIVQKEEIERNYTVFAHKLKIVSELFGKRREKQEALKYFSNLFDSTVLISQLSYTAGDEVLSFVLQSNSIFALENVFNIMNSDEVNEKYPTIEKNTLRRGSDGSYQMQVTLYFGDKPAPLPQATDETGVVEDGTTSPAEGEVSPETAPEPESVPVEETGT